MVKESNHTLDAREELVGVNVMKVKHYNGMFLWRI